MIAVINLSCFIKMLKVHLRTLQTLSRFCLPKIIDTNQTMMKLFQNIAWVQFLKPQCKLTWYCTMKYTISHPVSHGNSCHVYRIHTQIEATIIVSECNPRHKEQPMCPTISCVNLAPLNNHIPLMFSDTWRYLVHENKLIDYHLIINEQL